MFPLMEFGKTQKHGTTIVHFFLSPNFVCTTSMVLCTIWYDLLCVGSIVLEIEFTTGDSRYIVHPIISPWACECEIFHNM